MKPSIAPKKQKNCRCPCCLARHHSNIRATTQRKIRTRMTFRSGQSSTNLIINRFAKCSHPVAQPIYNREAPTSIENTVMAPQTKGASDHSGAINAEAALEVLEPELAVLVADPLPAVAVPVDAPPAF